MKKKQTRKAISDLATQLFMERGYHNVTTAEIARLANVSVPTLFSYFKTKESLIFDEDSEREKQLVDAVVNRSKGVSILASLQRYAVEHPAFKAANRTRARAFRNFIKATPELSAHERRTFHLYEESLAKVLRSEAKERLSEVEARAIAHFVLDAFYRAIDSTQPIETINRLFTILRNGWKS